MSDIMKLAALLPEGVHWGDELTPQILSAAIAADRAARAEPVAWAAQAGIAAIHAARSGRADNVQIPLSTYPGGDHSVGIYTAPPAAPVVPEGWKLVPVELTQEMIDAANSARGWVESDSLQRGCYRAMLAAAPAPSQDNGGAA